MDSFLTLKRLEDAEWEESRAELQTGMLHAGVTLGLPEQHVHVPQHAQHAQHAHAQHNAQPHAPPQHQHHIQPQLQHAVHGTHGTSHDAYGHGQHEPQHKAAAG